MRIGILTLHDSPNYGAVLQAYAMRAWLTGLGHEACASRVAASYRWLEAVFEKMSEQGMRWAGARKI